MAKTGKRARSRTAGKDSSLSPSANHRCVMERTRQLLEYQGGDFKAWQRKLRRKVAELTGFARMPRQRCPLRVRTLWRREQELGRIDKIVFSAEPGAEVPAFVCLPHNAKPPYDWFVCVQGHSTGMHNSIGVDRDDNRKPIAVEVDRDFARGCLRRGLAALCIEQRAFGERREQAQSQVSPHGCHDAAMHALMLGRTLLAERVYDVDRGIDYLCTRKDVRKSTLGIMGNSGGGTVSVFAAALLRRIRYAMPSCYFCTFRDSVMSIYHCADNYVPGLLRYAEMADVLGCAAPKPLVIVAGQEDPIFPIKATRRAFGRLRELYAVAGAADRCRLVVGPGGHRFYADLAWPRMLKLLGRS